MIKNILENSLGKKVDKDTFELALAMTTEDIIFNHIKYKKLTKLNENIKILIISVGVAERIKNVVRRGGI